MFAWIDDLLESAKESLTFQLLIKRAEKGDAKAETAVGYMYYIGEGGASQDYNKAFEWLVKSSMQGYNDANAFLATMHYEGKGVPKDLVKAYAYINIYAFYGAKNCMDIRDKFQGEMTPAQVENALEFSRELFYKIEENKKGLK